jgi:hypothetical protein
MIYEYEVNGLQMKTGDLICTTDGDTTDIKGKVWRLIGKLLPGEVDHIVIYVGPNGRCVEAGAKLEVITFEMPGHSWNAHEMLPQRGPLIDTFYGIAYPLEDRGLSDDEIMRIREGVAFYCLDQANLGRPYNINFFESDTERAFYCSQLAYRAYLRQGINLNTGMGVPNLPFTDSIIFPDEIWHGCAHRQG